MTSEEQFMPDQEARKSLALKLNLNFDDYMQDWEYEVADSNRILEFIEEYDKSETLEKEKQSLMEIILESSNDLLLDYKTDEFKEIFPFIIERLNINQELHYGTLNYWKSNGFEISSKLKNQL